MPPKKMYNILSKSGDACILAIGTAVKSNTIIIEIVTMMFKKRAEDKIYFWSSGPAWFTYFIIEVLTNACLISSTKEVTTRKRDHMPISSTVKAPLARIIVLTNPKIGIDNFCRPLKMPASSQLLFFAVFIDRAYATFLKI